MVGGGGLGVDDFGEHVCAYDALSFGIGCDLIRHFHIYAAGKQPSCVPGGVADQPPIFHNHRRSVG